jgi:hypothetical protein
VSPSRSTAPDAPAGQPARLTSRLAWTTSAVLFFVIPLAVLVARFSDMLIREDAGYDFTTYYAAAEELLRSGTPYRPIDVAAISAGKQYVYPPLTAVVVTPLTVFSQEDAGLVMSCLLLVAVLCTPLLLGVRDWRCYGVVVLWPPTVQSLQTANVTMLLVFAAAVAWRFRDHPRRAGFAVGVAFAVKFMLVPLAVWLAATRRYAAGLWAVGYAAVLLVGSWAFVAFDGLASYPDMLDEVTSAMDDRAYSLYAVALDFGAPSQIARVAWLTLGVVLLAGSFVAGRKGADRRAFVLSVAAAVALSPIVWLESFVFLLPIVALAQPRLGVAWLVPLGMWVTGGTHAPTTFNATGTLALGALTVMIALHSLRDGAQARTPRSRSEAAVEAT